VPRALIIEPAGNLGGPQRALLDLIEHLRGIEIAVCCPPAQPLVGELKKREIRVLPYFRALDEQSRWKHLRAARAATGVLRGCLSFRPDVLYLNQVSCYRVVLFAAVLLGPRAGASAPAPLARSHCRGPGLARGAAELPGAGAHPDALPLRRLRASV
jgi:hypothetical protein